MIPIARSQAESIFNILKEECGAQDHCREEFLQTVPTFGDQIYWCREFRFQGNLGFGGKLYNTDRLRVDYYPEDETPQRKAAAERAMLRIWRLFPYTYQQDEFSFLTVDQNRQKCEVSVAWLVMLWRHIEVGITEEEVNMLRNAQAYLENKIHQPLEDV